MEISTLVFLIFVVLAVSDVQAARSGPTLADRVAVMEEEIKTWKIVTVKAKTKRSTLARRMRLVLAEVDSLKYSLQNTKTQLKVITQELRHVRQEKDMYSESVGKLRDEMNKTAADLRDARMLISELNSTNQDLFATKQQITGLTRDLMTLNLSCCVVRDEAKETDSNESSMSTSSLSQVLLTTSTTTYPGTTAASTGPTQNNTVPPSPVTTQDSDLQASTTDVSDDLTPSKMVPPAPVTTQDSHATPSPADRRLYSASGAGDLETVKRILAAGHVDINTRGGYWSKTPVMEAAYEGHSDVVEFLVGRGADVSLVSGSGSNVLHYACLRGDWEIVKLIVSLNVVDINARNNNGETAADYARRQGHQRVAEFLVSRGGH
ncbi:ankyrin repeat and KH domain-containing protein mask-like isoform X2 [Haliotis rubra]|uniref:ankyrin repeat and KH domain-containing protein mask-like isoform X2 n=1 Tax=Haliotis rubra TaxID=36100 RepID=UPI001EE53156|nr:ankyrin repeat and KH domain-containing protein mask-like isoform X2 [Haliotis rubra]